MVCVGNAAARPASHGNLQVDAREVLPCPSPFPTLAPPPLPSYPSHVAPCSSARMPSMCSGAYKPGPTWRHTTGGDVPSSGRGMEGSRQHVCFTGGDALHTAPLAQVCSYLHVAKCHYCARVGETLKYVAEQYNFDTNWLRLWNYNFQITDPVGPGGEQRCHSSRAPQHATTGPSERGCQIPHAHGCQSRMETIMYCQQARQLTSTRTPPVLQDMILRSFLPVVIGSTYKVQPGDTLARIAARLRTTVKKIMEVNPDMHTPEIEPNQVCARQAASFLRWLKICLCAHAFCQQHAAVSSQPLR
jgi:hypothetical protein